MERIAEDNSLSVRLDNGKSVDLDAERARHIDCGYAVESSRHAAVDRVLITGDAQQIAREEKMFAHLSPQTRDLALYTSDSRKLVMEKPILGVGIGGAPDGIKSNMASVPTLSVPVVEMEELGIGL